jgi:hypothetical protein
VNKLAFDINELARNMLQGNKSNASLIPTENTNNYNNPISLLPSRPEFTPYQREEFDATVENGPGASLGWTWTKGVKSKQLWDDEQQAKADDAYKGYQTDLAAWTDAVNLWKTNQELQQQKLENQNAQLSALGLTPSAYAGDPSAQIRQLGSMYQSTSDPSLKAQYHKQALDLAKQAGWIQDGQVVDSVNSLPSMTMAGTPTFENQYKTDALNYEKEQDAYANALKAAKAQGGGGSNNGGKTPTQYNDANTQDFLSSLMKFRTSKYAQDFYSKNYANAVANGVNMDYILKKMKERWGVGNEAPEDYKE